jgi:hypothetical protein
MPTPQSLPTPQSPPTPQWLLERYIEAKDLVRPHLMQGIYAPDAVLTFSIATDSISFPPRVVGIDGITRTLVVDFGAKYSRCKTFYVCDSVPPKTAEVAILPWLVLMSEPTASRLRIGKGYYEWTLQRNGGGNLQVVAMHIHIEKMDAIDEIEPHLLETAQSVLSYPWLRPATLRSQFQTLVEADPAFAFLSDFRTPLDPVASGRPLSSPTST